MGPRRHLYTSESVSMGHPDKAADQVADAVLDAVLEADPRARVACEVLLTKGLGVVAGEISAAAPTDFEAVARRALRDIGYTSDAAGFDAATAEIRIAIQEQSPDIAIGVDRGEDGALGAGDQGMMFGYAVDETEELMPLPIVLAHRIVAAQAEARRTGRVEGLRPDAKAQVSVVYEDRRPVFVDSVVLSTQHAPDWTHRPGELTAAITEAILEPALDEWWRSDTTVHVNPTGRFEVGGPAADTGLTGRKIIVDTYGGRAHHGGGAFSGKDPTKVDRSAAYMARHIAKTVVTAGLAAECEVRLGYAIGIAEPVAVTVDTLGTGTLPEAGIEAMVGGLFDLTPAGIIGHLDLRRPIYLPTASHGHFGRLPGEAGDGTFSWESTGLADEMRRAAGAST